jgi:hypothetical protein
MPASLDRSRRRRRTWIRERALRRGVAPLLVLGACGYPPLPNLNDAAARDAAAGDAGGGDAAATGFCDPADLRVIVCYEFEGSTNDGSSHHLDAATTSVSFAPGKVRQAIQLGTTSAVEVNDSAAFDVATMTLEAWIDPAQLPLSTRAYIADISDQYSLYVDPTGAVSCSLVGGPSVATAGGAIKITQWTHVACTYDGTMKTAIYIDGSVAATKAGSGTLSTSGTGMAIGAKSPNHSDRLIGLIDQLRLMNVVRSAAEICADAGETSCP